MESCCKPGRGRWTMYLQGSNPAQLCIVLPAGCAASDTVLTECAMCLQAHTSTTTVKKMCPAQASWCMERVRHQQLNQLMRMGTRMGHRRPQVGLVCWGAEPGWLGRRPAAACVRQTGGCVTGSPQQPFPGGSRGGRLCLATQPACPARPTFWTDSIWVKRPPEGGAAGAWHA